MARTPDRETGIYMISQIGLDQGIELDLDEKSTPWVAELLSELEEEVDPATKSAGSFLRFRGVLEKRHTGTYDDFLLLNGELEGSFDTLCVSTGQTMKDTFEIDIHAVFLQKQLEKTLELEDEIDLYIEDEEYDLYYYERRQVDLKAALHEYIYLNKNPYPRSE